MQFSYRNKTFDLIGCHDRVHRIVEQTGQFYEAELLEYMVRVVGPKQPGSLCIDVGANIGNHAVFLGNYIGETVLAIEPHPRLEGVLRTNLQANVGQWQMFAGAAGATNTRGGLVCAEDDYRIGTTQVRSGSDVAVRTLDELLEDYAAEHGWPATIPAIKIDVEGMELEVLAGAWQTLQRYRPHLFIEALTRREYQSDANFLRPLGYRAVSRLCVSPVYHFAWQPSVTYRARTFFTAAYYKTFATAQRLRRLLTGRVLR